MSDRQATDVWAVQTDVSRWGLVAAVCGMIVSVLAGAGLAYAALRPAPSANAAPVPSRLPTTNAPSDIVLTRLRNPPRTEVRDGAGHFLAVFTDGARTVRLAGAQRTLSEPRYTSSTVTTDAWVRLAPQEWRAGAERGEWFRPWLRSALSDRSPDVLAVAMQYVYGAKVQMDSDGLAVAGDAAFGPLSEIDPDGRAENSDFYDYLGVSWSFPDGVSEEPSADRIRSLDCSGYLRMIFGYRLGYPLRGGNTPGPGLPRRAFAIAEFGPGVALMPNTGAPVRNLSILQPGDMVFFQGSPEIDGDGPATNTHIEHSGLYLGVDDRGHHRFVSSRTTANGPTMGDAGGESILDGTGYFAVKFRTARRI